jgi:Baseplate J-like protein
MPIQLPNLDDRTYNDLVAEGLQLIPTYAPEWTNYNPSDPGITLIELFAYITELLIYRLDRITDENKLVFLKLINGSNWKKIGTLDDEIRQTIQTLRTPDRAVTRADFERLALVTHPQIIRAHCIPKSKILPDGSIEKSEQSSYISVVIVSKLGELSSQQLINLTTTSLKKKSPIATRIIVAEPQFITIRLQVRLVFKPDSVERSAIAKLTTFFDPLIGGQTGNGWEFGRSIYISEIYELLDELPEVDYVEEVTILEPPDGNSRRVIVNQKLMAISLNQNELVKIEQNNIQIN